MVHTCIKFDSHWTYIASTCFTMLPTDQKLKHDDALTWVIGFGSNLVWCSYLVVGSCSKSFKANGIPYHALASQCPLATSKLWEFIVGVWLRKWWCNLVEIIHDHMSLHKKSHQQWIKRNGTPITKLHSAPTDK